MKKLSLLLIGLIGYIQFAVAAPTKAEADEAYQKEKFSEAASLYEEILQTQENRPTSIIILEMRTSS